MMLNVGANGPIRLICLELVQLLVRNRPTLSISSLSNIYKKSLPLHIAFRLNVKRK